MLKPPNFPRVFDARVFQDLGQEAGYILLSFRGGICCCDHHHYNIHMARFVIKSMLTCSRLHVCDAGSNNRGTTNAEAICVHLYIDAPSHVLIPGVPMNHCANGHSYNVRSHHGQWTYL